MKSLLLDRDAWDLVLDANGNIACASEPYSRAQDVACECRLFRGEQWYDKRRGIPFDTEILGSRPPLSLVKARLKAAAESVEGVISAQAIITGIERTVSVVTPRVVETENYGNLLRYSERFDNSVWTKNSCDVSPNSEIAPDGTLTADILTATGTYSYASQVVGFAGGTPFCFSVWLISSTPTTMTLGLSQYPSLKNIIDTNVRVDQEWKRFYISGITVINTTGLLVVIGGFGGFTTGESVRAWGAQLTESGSPMQYQQTLDVPIAKKIETRIEYARRSEKVKGLTGQIQFIDTNGAENGVTF